MIVGNPANRLGWWRTSACALLLVVGVGPACGSEPVTDPVRATTCAELVDAGRATAEEVLDRLADRTLVDLEVEHPGRPFADLDPVLRRDVFAARAADLGCGETELADLAAQEHLALLEGQLELAYQPIVAVAGGNTAQYQVLLRLRQADGSVLAAGQVIPAAEAAGRIADLDQQVLDHALGLLDLYRHAAQPLHLFVSQSLRTLARDAFGDWLLESLASRQIDGSALVIDVRLPDALIHTVTLQQFCTRMHAAGVRFCLSPVSYTHLTLPTTPYV